MHHQPDGRIGELGEAHPLDRGHLARANGRDRARLPPPREYRNDPEPGRRDERFGQGTDHIDAGRVHTDFLGGLPQRRRDRPLVPGVDGPAGEGRLARMQAQARAALNEQQVRATGAVAEQDEDGRRPAARGGRREERGDLHRLGGGRQLAQPRRRGPGWRGPG